MAGSSSPNQDHSKSSDLKPQTHTFKKRKVVEKTIVTVRIGANDEDGKLIKNEGPPSDFWSWRKYGQKPIKGSPYPRNYYRCSTSKGCSAKKQVERSRTDASLLVITYTSGHNHPGPDLRNIETTSNEDNNKPSSPSKQDEETPSDSKQDQESTPAEDQTVITSDREEDNNNDEEGHSFHYLELSPLNTTQSEFLFADNSERRTHWGMSFLLDDKEPPCFSKSEENYDFFDELEELIPISSSSAISLAS